MTDDLLAVTGNKSVFGFTPDFQRLFWTRFCAWSVFSWLLRLHVNSALWGGGDTHRMQLSVSINSLTHWNWNVSHRSTGKPLKLHFSYFYSGLSSAKFPETGGVIMFLCSCCMNVADTWRYMKMRFHFLQLSENPAKISPYMKATILNLGFGVCTGGRNCWGLANTTSQPIRSQSQLSIMTFL